MFWICRTTQSKWRAAPLSESATGKATCKAPKQRSTCCTNSPARWITLCAACSRIGSAPLVLAADEPLASIFRSVNTYPGLIDETIAGNPNLMTDAQIEDAALPMLDRLYERAIKAAIVRFDELKPRRATTDVSFAAHAVTAGAVDELLVDLDADVPGLVSEFDGSVTYAASDEPRYTVSSMKSRAGRSIPARGCSVHGAMNCPTGRLWSPSCAINSG
jgi:hypothetical protein